MLLARRHRQTLCRWLVGVLLAMQWLVASHACPPGVLPGTAATAHDAAVPDCHRAMLAEAHQAEASAAPQGGDAALGASPTDAGLCKAHCTAGQQVPADVPASAAPPPLCGWCLVLAPLPVVEAPATRWATTPAASGAPPPGWPPLFIAHGALRN